MSRDSRSATSLKIFADGRESYSVEANKKIRIVIDAGSHDIGKATLYLLEIVHVGCVHGIKSLACFSNVRLAECP